MERRAEPEAARPGQDDAPAEFESYPLTRGEYINAVIHFYRGELSRSTAWRARIDQTTYWAMALAAGLFSFSFSQPEHGHFTLLFGILLLLLFLLLESRRYRRYDAWYARVRMIEENFYLPILRRDLKSPMEQWRTYVAEDLMTPRYKITLWEAIGIRLIRNYVWLFLVMLVGWLAKIAMHPEPANSWPQLFEHMRIGIVPPGLVLGTVSVFYVGIVIFALAHRHLSADREMRREMLPENIAAWKQV